MSGIRSRGWTLLPLLLLYVWTLFVGTAADYCDNPNFPRSCWFVHCTQRCPRCVIGEDGGPVAECEADPDNPPVNYISGGASPSLLLQPGQIAGIILAGLVFWCCVALTPVCCRRLRQRWCPTVAQGRAARNARIQAQVRANVQAHMAARRVERAKQLARVRAQPMAGWPSPAVSPSQVQMTVMPPRSPPPSQQPAALTLRVHDEQQPQPVYVYAAQPVSYAQPAPSQQPSILPPSYAEIALDDAPPPPYVEPLPSLFDASKPYDNVSV